MLLTCTPIEHKSELKTNFIPPIGDSVKLFSRSKQNTATNCIPQGATIRYYDIIGLCDGEKLGADGHIGHKADLEKISFHQSAIV
jgi:hypothetical protein